MLMPKKVKFRKVQRGRMKGKAWTGSTVDFGDYGLKAMECGWVSQREIEAGRIAITRFIKRNGRTVSSSRINWAKADLSAYKIYQPSGDDNALGLVKLLFPNKHSVYLHDTPSKSLFNDPVASSATAVCG